MEELFERPRIVVLGVGGAGCNSINRLAKMGIQGAELVAVNTDKQHLDIVSDEVTKILIGKEITRGLGAGGDPQVGAKAAEASREMLHKLLEGTHLLFLLAGMGGGTGTGASPVIARIAAEEGAIVVSMVTFPFRLERKRTQVAKEGIKELSKYSDTVVIIDNNRLLELVPNLPLDEAFKVADMIIARAVRGIVETIMVPSLINLDFADVKAIMRHGGIASMSVGEGKGINRVKDSVEGVLNNALLDADLRGAKGVLIHITGGPDLTLGEANQIGTLLTELVDPDATVAFGARVDPEFKETVEVIGIFTGLSSSILDVKNEPEEAPLDLEFI